MASRVSLVTLLGRPAYRLGAGRDGITVFADNGEQLTEIGKSEAVQIAAQFMRAPASQLGYALQTSADVWTLGVRRQLPLHKLRINDSDRTELYVSPHTGEVVLLTTRRTRMLAWVAAIPHWMYFTPLRVRDSLWNSVVLWTSGKIGRAHV